MRCVIGQHAYQGDTFTARFFIIRYHPAGKSLSTEDNVRGIGIKELFYFRHVELVKSLSGSFCPLHHSRVIVDMSPDLRSLLNNLKISFIDDFNSEPAGSTKKNDYRLISSIDYAF